MFVPINTTTPLVEASFYPTSIPPPTNILNTAIQQDNAKFDDFDDKADTIELTDEKLCNHNFNPIEVDDSYFNDNFISIGTGEYQYKKPLLILILWYFIEGFSII